MLAAVKETAPAEAIAVELETVTLFTVEASVQPDAVCVPAANVAPDALNPPGAVQVSVYSGELEQKSIRKFFARAVAVKLTRYDVPVALAAELLIWILRVVS
jgi:hypothetical protein